MRTTLAPVLAAAVAASQCMSAIGAGDVTGRVVPSPERGLVAKSVWVGSVHAPVSADGTFRAVGIPAGSSQLAIETSEGLYLVATPVIVAPGTTRRVHLAFAGRQDSNAPPSEEAGKKKHGSVWSNPLSATLIIVGSAIVLGVAVDELTKSDTPPPSPSTTSTE